MCRIAAHKFSIIWDDYVMHHFNSFVWFLASLYLYQYRCCAAFILGKVGTKSQSVRSAVTSRSMHTFSNTLSQFLNNVHYQVTMSGNNISLPAHIVIGNPAGDCDSIVSALAFAYIQSQLSNTTYIPILPISSSEMKFRRDATILLQQCGVDIHKLIFLDNHVVENLLLQRPLSITLVDHNKLAFASSSKNQDLSQYVVEILDHHADEGAHSHCQKNIAFHNGYATVGSCCTLVGERLVPLLKPSHTIDPGLSLSLLGTILLDTANMNCNTNRGAPRDQQVIDFLLNHSEWTNLLPSKYFSSSDKKPCLDYIFQWLQNAKFDADFWNEMTFLECLELDYKEYATSSSLPFGISSILIPSSQLETKEGFNEGAAEFMKLNNLQFLVIMSLVLNGHDNDSPKRELLILSQNKKVLDDIAKFLLDSHGDTSFLEIIEKVETADTPPYTNLFLKRFEQGNLSASRKVIAPIFTKFY